MKSSTSDLIFGMITAAIWTGLASAMITVAIWVYLVLELSTSLAYPTVV